MESGDTVAVVPVSKFEDPDQVVRRPADGRVGEFRMSPESGKRVLGNPLGHCVGPLGTQLKEQGGHVEVMARLERVGERPPAPPKVLGGEFGGHGHDRPLQWFLPATL